MLFLKYMLLAGAIVLFALAIALIASILYPMVQRWRKPPDAGKDAERDETLSHPETFTLVFAARLGGAAFLLLLLAITIVVVPSGKAGVRVSQLSGTVPGTLYPGTHLVLPLVQHVALYDVREKLFSEADDPPPPNRMRGANSR